MHERSKSATQLLLALTLTTSAILLVGCEDEAAREREELQATVAQANNTLREATLLVVRPDNKEQFERIRTDLNKVVSSLRSVGSGETGQEMAVNLLLADAGQKLAALSLAEVDQTAETVRENQTLARTQIRALLRLNAFVTAAESIDITEESSALDNAKTSAGEQLRAASEMLAQLDEPISRLSAENSDDAAKIADLRSQAEQLLRRASEQGPADGFPQYEEAVAKNRQAGAIETQIARREVDLAYQYEPEHQSAGSRAQHLQQFIDTIEKTKQNLNAIAQSISAEANKTNSRIADYRKSIDQRLSDVNAAIAGPLEESYRSGLDAADKALSAAKAASRQRSQGDKGNSAKLLEAQVLETQGRLHWARARALAEQVSLLDAAIAAGDAIGSSGQYQQQRGKAQQALDESLTLARDAYTSAQTALPAGNSNELNALNRSLEMAIGALSGKDTSTMSFSTPDSGMGASGAGNPTGGGAGYQTPEALLAALQRIDTKRPETSVTVLQSAWHAKTPLQQQLMDASLDVLRATVDFGEAAREQFGAAFAEGFATGMSSTMPDFANATISQDSDTTASMTVPGGPATGGQPQVMPLIRLESGDWKIDFGGMIQNSPQGQIMTTDQQIQQAQAMAGLFRDFTERVRNGEFANEDEFGQAFMQAMMQMQQGG